MLTLDVSVEILVVEVIVLKVVRLGYSACSLSILSSLKGVVVGVGRSSSNVPEVSDSFLVGQCIFLALPFILLAIYQQNDIACVQCYCFDMWMLVFQ